MTAPRPVTRPWGRAAGLLAGSLVTLVGVVRNLDPEVILGRALLAGLVCGVLAALIAAAAR